MKNFIFILKIKKIWKFLVIVSTKTCLPGTNLNTKRCLPGTKVSTKWCLPGTNLSTKMRLPGTKLDFFYFGAEVWFFFDLDGSCFEGWPPLTWAIPECLNSPGFLFKLFPDVLGPMVQRQTYWVVFALNNNTNIVAITIPIPYSAITLPTWYWQYQCPTCPYSRVLKRVIKLGIYWLISNWHTIPGSQFCLANKWLLTEENITLSRL